MKTSLYKQTSATLLLIVLTMFSPKMADAAPSSEASCPNVDLRSDFDFGLTRNQKFLGWCYSYAGADVVGHYLGQKVSSFDLAVQVAQIRITEKGLKSKTLTAVSGGSARDLAKAMNNVGICAGDQISSSYPLASVVVRDVETAAIQVAESRSKGLMSDLELQKFIFARAPTFQKIFPKTNVYQLIEYFKNLKNDGYPLAQLFDQVCGQRARLNLEWGYQANAQNSTTMKHLLKNKKAIYITWASKTLEDLKQPIGPVGHASSVIAMRFNKSKNTCEFMIRNSYGNYPQRAYDPEIRTQVSNGNVWVSEELITKMVQLIGWIKN